MSRLYPEWAPLRRVAVCPPTYFTLREPINVIQATHVAAGRQIAASQAMAEHAALVEALREADTEVLAVEPDPLFPYQINTRDAALATPDGVIVGRFRLPARQGEEQLVRSTLLAAGVEPLGAVRGAAFEGGDFIALNGSAAGVGVGARTERPALTELQTLLGLTVELIPVEFDERFLHLDMIFNVVADQLALACRSALPKPFLDRLTSDGFRLLEVREQEVFRHGCNVLALGPARVLSPTANERVNTLLRAEGLDVLPLELGELAKSGGGPRCLTLPLERETR